MNPTLETLLTQIKQSGGVVIAYRISEAGNVIYVYIHPLKDQAAFNRKLLKAMGCKVSPFNVTRLVEDDLDEIRFEVQS